MLRFLWKCVLEVLPPTCATVVAGILLSAYHEHALPLENVIDPRVSFERVAAPAPEGGKQQQAVIAPQVRSEPASDPARIDRKASAPGSNANSAAAPAEGSAADGKTPGIPDSKPREAPTTDAQSAQLDAMLMASSPMSQPPAEIKAAPSPEAKSPDSVAAEGRPAPGGPAEAVPATEVSASEDKPAAVTLSADQAVASVDRPRFSRHVPKPAHKVTSFKAEAERLPPPLVAMVPLPPPATPAMDNLEAAPQTSPSRSVLRSRPHTVPTRPQVIGSTTPQADASPPQAIGSAPQAIGATPPQEIGPTPPAIVPNVGVVGAAGPTSAQSSPAAPQGGLNSSQEDATKTSEPKRVFGVPIPSTIVAVGDALDPRPVLSAGQKAFDKIVTTAKSVVPDFGHSQ
jgi:hypothetical protein